MSKILGIALPLTLGAAALAACYGVADGTYSPDSGAATATGTNTTSGTGSGTGTGTTTGPSGLPCDVQAILQTNCTSCHTDPPVSGPMGLETYADLTKPAVTNPSVTVAQLCLTRMQDTAKPMPPGGALSATDIATFQAWVTAGAPTGTCAAAADAGNPYATAVVCTNGMSSGRGGGQSMRPGQPCISCHASQGGEAPIFSIAGTVYPTAHEPDNCQGQSGITVVITDKAGAVLTLTTNSAGNFSSQQQLQLPYTAEVQSNGKTRKMATPQTSGDCNGCHTEMGTNTTAGQPSAPGRIMAP
jgi:hypothetical protein